MPGKEAALAAEGDASDLPYLSAHVRCLRASSALQTLHNAAIAHKALLDSSKEGRYQLHAWVVMPDHLHALITPAGEQSLERYVMVIQGGISFRLRDAVRGTLWQKGG
jgi:REP element-mobilizing transposase RayT